MRVFVAMSGGVDSSVSLFLLKRQGYEVIGVTLQLGDDYQNPIIKSKQLCKKLDIEHVVIDYRNEFKKEIIEVFNKEILHGLTPVPCVACNRKIKLGKLVDFCMENDAKLATGHYAKLILIDNEYCVCRAKDKLKDQTHFLCSVKKDNLKNIIFPLGDKFKSEVFRIAMDNNLIVLDEYRESQEVCFFNGDTYSEYIKSLGITEHEGLILHVKTNKKIGTHFGLLKYTIGQRQGINVAWTEPLYVVKKDYENNILYVGEEKYLYSKSLNIKNINILSNNFKTKILNCDVCIRDKTPIVSANVNLDMQMKKATVCLNNPARAITPGQMCVFYDKDRLLGGGEII